MRFISYLALSLCLPLTALPDAVTLLQGTSDHYWHTLWSTAMLPTIPEGPYSNIARIPPAYNTNQTAFLNATIRQTFTMTQPASRLRLRVSNVYSSSLLNLTAVTVAFPEPNTSGSSVIDTSSLVQVYFGGNPGVLVPAGAEFLSDPVDFAVVPQCQLSVSAGISSPQCSLYHSHYQSRGSRRRYWVGQYH